MKKSIHPQLYKDAQVLCSCGNAFVTGSVIKNIHVEVCYKCHPFYTGEHRFLDTKGRVGAFQKKQEMAKKHQLSIAGRKKIKEKEEKKTKSLKELLSEI